MLGIYCRISKDKEEGKDRSINDQKQSGIELAKSLGIEYRVYIDEGLSGTLPIEERPDFSRLIDDIYNKTITKVYVYDQSRLERQPEVRFTLKRIFDENNIQLYTQAGLVSNDPQTRAVGDIVSIANNLYVELTKMKIKSVLRRNAQEGRAFSVNPYGYRTGENKKLVIDEEEAKVVRQIFEMSLNGVGTDSIAIELRKQEIPTRRGGTWSGKQVQEIIKNPIHKGQRRWGNNVYDAPHIFTAEYWEKVNTNLHNNRNSGEQVMKFNYLLKGLCTCAICERNYYGRTRKAKEGQKPRDHYYMCSSKRKGQVNCGNRSIGIDKLEGLVWDIVVNDGVLKERLLEHIENNENRAVQESIKEVIRTKEEELKRIETQRKKLLDLYLEDDVTQDLYNSKMKSLQAKNEVLISELSRLDEQLEKTEIRKSEVIEELNDENLSKLVSFEEKKELLKKYIDCIKILSTDKGAHYVGINMVNDPIPLIYHVAYKGAVRALTVGEIRANKELLSKLSSGQEYEGGLLNKISKQINNG